MDKEKEIEEMASDIENICAVADDSCREKQCSSCMAKYLIEAGYRKADEVRKETAKEILDLLIRYDDGDSNSEAIKLIIDHYGLQEYIEVDE